MISVKEADKKIFDHVKSYPCVKIPLQEAFGRVLCEDLCADRDMPQHDRATMDGIAIHFNSWESGNRSFLIEGIQKAGIPSLSLKNKNACVEIMTGAVLPKECDCVIPVEQITMEKGQALLKGDVLLTSRMNIRTQGSDCTEGALLVTKGVRLLSPVVAVAASIGKAEILVSQSPKIAVVGTGDELISIEQKPEIYQIRRSNSYALQSALHLQGYIETNRFHIKDDRKELRTHLSKILNNHDVIILSGGVSMGKFDFIPEILNELGVPALFHKIKQRPGKPFWFGKSKDGKPIFALPGNPVSTQIVFARYVLPYLEKASGLNEIINEFAVLNEDFKVNTDLTYFLPVKVRSGKDGRLKAQAIAPNSSGDFVSLAKSDGFIEIPEHSSQYSKGESAKFYRWQY